MDSPTELTFERSFYIGGQITAILFGIHLVIYFLSCRLLLHERRASRSKFYLIYGTVLLALWIIALSCNAIFGQYVWIDFRDPDGPAAFLGENISAWYNTLGTTAGVAMNFMADAMLLYRCRMIWGRWGLLVVTFPAIMYLGALSMAILLIFESAQPGANFFKGHAVDFGVPYVSLTISMNIIVTALICIRLLALRKQVMDLLGPEHTKMYTSVVSMMVESALPFTTLGIAYVISYAKHSPTSIAFVQVWGDFAALSPQLIILRISLGKGWTRDTVDRLASTHLTFDDTYANTVFSGGSTTKMDSPISPIGKKEKSFA
ncbi:hypothetical protein K435DRAFT_727002 [Dendrothele bispora CBS 962.96]|uniref:Fungal pheromone STE3G-protein-coupled receptor n=1 Tax=Dendrothele bispora (strain CBS 962.96) TaxID=1314807 RepID=A0A4S8LQX8_DENBC|nr:hypothetical protein K435DRAFT_727002 [Dendrothele bispora CBS 962.96]